MGLLTLPVVLVVAGAGQGDGRGQQQRGQEGAEAPGLAPAPGREAVQLPCQVEGGEGQAGEGNCKP